LYYKGVYYDVGTKVKLQTKWDGIIVATYAGYGEFKEISKYHFNWGLPPERYIVKIIEPVYYEPPKPEESSEKEKKVNIFLRSGSGSWQSSDTILYGLFWYIAIMLIGAIFKDRWLIWIITTIVFFSWKAKK
jgi:hypothetical protein